MSDMPHGLRAGRRPGGRLGRPPHQSTVQRIRWLYLVLAVVTLLIMLPPVVSEASASPARLAAALVSAAALLSCWVSAYRHRALPLVLDVVHAGALAGIALTAPRPDAVFPVLFAAMWFASQYGSRSRVLLRCALWQSGPLLALPLWAPHGEAKSQAVGALIVTLPVLVLTAAVGHTLAMALREREQSTQRDAALVAFGSGLLGLTSDAEVLELGWVAVTDICAATPGLRVVLVSEQGAGLAVQRCAGELPDAPGELPLAALPDSDGGQPAEVLRCEELDAAAGARCTWLALAAPRQDTAQWLLVGAPGAVPGEALVAVRSMLNQLTLALRSTRAHQELSSQARTDSLTGLANRPSFTEYLEQQLAGAADRLALLFIDLDDFKDVNDVLGHGAGDSLLREVAVRLQQVTRPGDLCARLGGDEFAVVLHDTDDEAAVAVAGRIVAALARPVEVGSRTARVGASVGVSYGRHAAGLHELVQQADVAMYAAKANGKNGVRVFREGLLHVDPDTALERQLAKATPGGELVVCYQPVLSLPELRCTAAEALVRWRHPTRGLLPPDAFIQPAERTGAITEIGAFVLDRACADAAGWPTDPPVAVHVNVSAVQLDDEHFVDVVTRCLTEHALPPERLVLEITETVVLDSPVAIDRLRMLCARGVGLAIDDFGTGYSAPTTLRTLPVDIVKIDKTFVAGAADSPADRAVIDAIVQMSTRLGLQTIAEGVERLDQQQFLLTSGADSVQGYLYALPLPAAGFADWLDANRLEQHERAVGPGASPGMSPAGPQLAGGQRSRSVGGRDVAVLPLTRRRGA